MAFYAFDEPLPGCTKLCAQQLQHPHVRTRIGMESSSQWDVSDAPLMNTMYIQLHVKNAFQVSRKSHSVSCTSHQRYIYEV
jgi:hypothetical protein